MTVRYLLLACLPPYSFTWSQLLASGLLDCVAGLTIDPVSFLLAVIVFLLQLLSEIVHNMACLSEATATGKAVKDEQQQMLQLAAGWGVVDAASHQTI